MRIEPFGEDPVGVDAQAVLQRSTQHGGGGKAFDGPRLVRSVDTARRGHLLVVKAVVGLVGAAGRGPRDAAYMGTVGGDGVGKVAVFGVSEAHDAANVVAVAAVDDAGIVAVLDSVGDGVPAHHAADVVVGELGSLLDGDAAGVEAAPSRGQIAADAAEEAAFVTGKNIARIGALHHHTTVADDTADTVGRQVGTTTHLGDDVRIVDTVDDGVAADQLVSVLDASGQRRTGEAADAAGGVVVVDAGGLDMTLDGAVHDFALVHQGADGAGHNDGGIRMNIGKVQVAHLTAQHAEETANIGFPIKIDRIVVEAEVSDSVPLAEEGTRKAAAAEN